MHLDFKNTRENDWSETISEQTVKIPVLVFYWQWIFYHPCCSLSPLSSALPQLQLKTSQQPRPALLSDGKTCRGAAVMEVSWSRRAKVGPGAAAKSRWMEASSPVVVTCLTGTIWRWLGAHLNNWFSTFPCAEDGRKAFRLPVEQDAQKLSNQCQHVQTNCVGRKAPMWAFYMIPYS